MGKIGEELNRFMEALSNPVAYDRFKLPFFWKEWLSGSSSMTCCGELSKPCWVTRVEPNQGTMLSLFPVQTSAALTLNSFSKIVF